MKWGQRIYLSIVGLVAVTVAAGSFGVVSANRYTSPNYTIDASVGNNFGGTSGSSSYQLVSSGGESIIGDGAGGSYMLATGYVAQLSQSLQLTTTDSAVAFSDLIAGTPQTADVGLEVLTDAPGYLLAVAQDNDLTSGGNTIPAVGSTIASPAGWSDGTTKGLGFSVASASGTAPDVKWSTGTAYAAVPNTATTFYERNGYTGGSIDTVTARLKIDIESNQALGTYSNTITWTGTIIP